MEGNALQNLFTIVGEVITSVMGIFTEVATTLMSNPLFQITLGLIILSIVIGLVMYFVRKIKRH